MISDFQSVFHSIENGYDLRYYREGYANVTEKKTRSQSIMKTGLDIGNDFNGREISLD